jgi:catechol-2,3-dioxygenase
MAQTIDLNAHVTSHPGTFFPNEAAWNPPKVPSTVCHNTGIHHVGLRATDPATSTEFYRDVLGTKIGRREGRRPSALR